MAPYVERLGELAFARKETAQIFATTYPLFHDGKIDNPEQKDTVVSAILKDQVFTQNTGMTEEGLRAVFSPDGGVDYMIKNMALRIDASRRRSHCSIILGQDREELLRLIKCQLPSDEAQSADEQKLKLRELRHKVEEILAKIEEDDDTSKFMEFAVCVKRLFSAPFTIFDALPLSAEHMSKKEIKEYVKKQVAKWYDYKTANLEESDYLSKEEMQAVLVSLRDTADAESLFRFIKDNYSQINNRVMAEAARYPFSVAFSNLLQFGQIALESGSCVGECNPQILEDFIKAESDKDSAREWSPYYHCILLSFISRLEFLAENGKASARPPQEGDAELKAILDKIAASDGFQTA